MSHQVTSLSNPFFSLSLLLLHFFFFYIKLSLLTNLELSFPFLCGIRERESKTRDQKLCRRQGIRETMSNWAQARSWDIRTMRSEALSMIGDSRNDVRLSLGQIMRHVEKDWLVGSTILEKGGLKSWDIWLGFLNKQKFWSFWVIVGFELWVMDFEFKLWVMNIELWKLSYH